VARPAWRHVEEFKWVKPGVFSLVLSMSSRTISFLFRMNSFVRLLSPNELVSLETKTRELVAKGNDTKTPTGLSRSVNETRCSRHTRAAASTRGNGVGSHISQ